MLVLKLVCCVSEIQTQLGVLCFYVLRLAIPLTRRLETRVFRSAFGMDSPCISLVLANRTWWLACPGDLLVPCDWLHSTRLLRSAAPLAFPLDKADSLTQMAP